MASLSYHHLALAWTPDNQERRFFYITVLSFLAVALIIGILTTAVKLPPKERKPRQIVPERVAKFIAQKKVIPKPKPKVTPVRKPIPRPKPKVIRKKQTEAEKRKPITQIEKNAREKASQSGLLALGNELADLIDTSAVDKLVSANTRQANQDAKRAANVDTSALVDGITEGSGGVESASHVVGVSSTTLSAREIALVKQSLLKGDRVDGVSTEVDDEAGEDLVQVRTEEEVTMVFDQNKGQLFAIYNRERRKKPGLRGKLVLNLTISPEGKVTEVNVASSELNDSRLESRILARVKLFKFDAKDVEPVTVSFPIEFLPY